MINSIIKFLISIVGFVLKYLVENPKLSKLPERIAVLLWGGIGNHVLFSPALFGIRERFPDAQLSICSFHLFARQMFSKTANSFITVDENPSLKALLRLLFYVRRYKPDIVLSNAMSPTFLTSLIAFLSGAKVRIGIDRAYRGFLNNIRIGEKNEHEVLMNNRIVKALKIDAEERPLTIDVSDNDIIVADKTFRSLFEENDESPLVAIQPGSGKRQVFKRWRKENFEELTRKLLQEGLRVIIVGTDEEKEEMRYIEKSLKHKRLRVLKQSLTLPQITKFLQNVDLIIANDTSLVHLGAISGVPSVVIYGPTNPEKNKPWGVKAKIVRKQLPCSPCYDYHTPRCNYGFKCLTDITTEDVLFEVKAILGN
ncbi:glycosyltransferase family 9 protein [candidate division WOR-3 bacterium]|nr:glycosyltransferase family 9 protein [candidate division WOR-3 bacterium]